MTWQTLWWLVLFVVGAGVPVLVYVVVGRVFRRWAVRDPARRHKALIRKHKAPGSRPWGFVGVLIMASLGGGTFLPYEFGVPFPIPIDLSLTVTFRLIQVMLCLYFVVTILTFAEMNINLWREKRFYDRLEREEHLICPDCHYSLAGHTAGGHCPECGYTFTPESLVEDWTDVRKLARRRPSRSRRQ